MPRQTTTTLADRLPTDPKELREQAPAILLRAVAECEAIIHGAPGDDLDQRDRIDHALRRFAAVARQTTWADPEVAAAHRRTYAAYRR